MPIVSFESNKGTAVNSQEVAIGNLITEPQNPTRTNYTFIGWYTTSNFTEAWDFANDTVSVDITLYAKWRITFAAKLKEILLGIKADVNSRIPKTEKGQPEGVATLDANGKVPVGQINEVFNEVLEFNNKAAFPTTGEAAKIYVDRETKVLYLWNGSAYEKAASTQIYFQDEQPSIMVEGDIWLDID